MDPTTAVNSALAELGDTLIDSLDAQTHLSQTCRLIYPQARDFTLELHAWNFAHFQADLDRSEVTPPASWASQFLLPTGVGFGAPPYCLVVLGTALDPGGPPWEPGNHPSDGRVLWSNEETVAIHYTGRVENLNAWNSLAMDILIKVLGSKLAKALTGQNSLAQGKLQEALALLPLARRRDGREGTPMVARANSLLLAQRLSTGGLWGGGTLRYPRTFTVGGQ
jgi:hypothetical protein